MDFTIEKYKELLDALLSKGYSFQTFKDFLIMPKDKAIILRHDVDLLPYNSLRFAEIQSDLDIQGTYYFRLVPESWDEKIVKRIQELNHEVGYHYETMSHCHSKLLREKTEPDFEYLLDTAYKEFESNLKYMRRFVQIDSICMHGSPLSKYDNKLIWNKYDYKKLGLIGEPYFDLDFDKILYLTDTGRRWDGHNFSVRDKVESSFDSRYRKTDDIINAIEKSKDFPNQVMFTFHPQRWHDGAIQWTKELAFQNIKNMIKKYFFVKENQVVD
jgi:hypothetical protein